MTDAGPPRLEAIWLKTGRGGPMQAVDEAILVEGSGLEGNADRGGRRQVTLLDASAWEQATRSVGADIPPVARRANLLVRGIDLAASTDRVLQVGDARIEIRGETLPCGQMEAAAPGLRAALEPEWQGGAYGIVLAGGSISIGDKVGWE